MAESPDEKEALAKLDEETEEVVWKEGQKEWDREFSSPWTFRGIFRGPVGGIGGWLFGRFRLFRPPTWRNPVPEPVDKEDPGGGPSMRDVMHESQQEAAAHVDREKS